MSTFSLSNDAMRLAFPHTVTLLPDNRYEVRFRDFDVAVARATVGEALDSAMPLLLAKIEEHLKAGDFHIDIPARPGESLFFFSILLSVKVLLKRRCLEADISTAELARRMGLRPQEAARILDLSHATKIDTMERALYAVGLQLDFTVTARSDWDATPYR